MDPNWAAVIVNVLVAFQTLLGTIVAPIVVAVATVFVAKAAIGSTKAAERYADLTHQLISAQRESQLNDRFPCIVVRSRLIPRRDTSTGYFPEVWTIRLVNIGQGPAFIKYFRTAGLSDCGCEDGEHTQDIDKVIGPNVSDPDLRVEFARGQPDILCPATLRSKEVIIIIGYHDIAGRSFESGIKGQPFYKPPESLTRILG
jgi:hypothetical protein